jgi:hypothetical protein
MRRWLLDIHLYLGLFCLPYVVVFGVSSLLMNHDVARTSRSEWTAQIAPLAPGELGAQAAAALDALDLVANALPHTLARGEAGELAFRAIRPGRTYQVAVDAAGVVTVSERNEGVLGVLRGLHGASDPRLSLWSFGWAVYTELTTAMLVFSLASGLYLFVPRPSGRALGLGLGALGVAVCGAAAAVIW